MKGQSVFTSMSKSIGWQPKEVIWPSVEEAQELRGKVSMGDRNAFYKVFGLYRYLPSPIDSNQVYIQNVLIAAFQDGEKKWRNVEDERYVEENEMD